MAKSCANAAKMYQKPKFGFSKNRISKIVAGKRASISPFCGSEPSPLIEKEGKLMEKEGKLIQIARLRGRINCAEVQLQHSSYLIQNSRFHTISRFLIHNYSFCNATIHNFPTPSSAVTQNHHWSVEESRFVEESPHLLTNPHLLLKNPHFLYQADRRACRPTAQPLPAATGNRANPCTNTSNRIRRVERNIAGKTMDEYTAFPCVLC